MKLETIYTHAKSNDIASFIDILSKELSISTLQKIRNDIETPKDNVLETVSYITGISSDDIKGRSRNRPVSDARAVYCYVMRKKYNLRYPVIGYEIGLNRASVRYNVTKVENLYHGVIKHQVDGIFAMLN